MLYFFIFFLFLVLCELLLWLAFIFTNKDVFKKKNNNCYPLFYWNRYKIAIFGGSAAAGYNAEINFASILNLDIKHMHSRIKSPYIHNFASNGMPFYGAQAEIAMDLCDKFDLIIVYAGNNEGMYFLNEHIFLYGSGFYDRIQKFRVECKKKMSLLSKYRFEQLSYTVSFTSNILCAMYEKFEIKKVIKKRKNLKSANLDLKFISTKPHYSLSRMKKDLHRFTECFNKLISKSDSGSTRVFVVAIENNDLVWEGESEITSDTIISHEKLLEEINSGSLNSVSDLLLVDRFCSGIGYIYFLLAQYYLKLEKTEKAIDFLLKCQENTTSLIGRSSLSTNIKLKEICDASGNGTFISCKEIFYSYLKNINDYHSLFIDTQHLSNLGHIIIAKQILNHIPLFSDDCKHSSVNVMALKDNMNELLRLKDFYFSQFLISEEATAENYFRRMKWFLSVIEYTSDPSYYIDNASHCLDMWWSYMSSDDCYSVYLFWSSVLALKNGDHISALNKIRKAKKLNPSIVERMKDSPGFQISSYRDYFKVIDA